MPILSILAVTFAFARESFRLFSKPQYRSMLIWVGILLAIGSAFYKTVEGWGWLDSLYFCVVTLATVGYGDLTPTTAVGKAFAIVYILLGLGILATFASMLAKERLDMMTERRGDKDGAAQQAK
ncbi:MAG: potassium channel family protein [Candidatus Promineifilaceae bacterium]|jgi:voltage-gated potassium channel